MAISIKTIEHILEYLDAEIKIIKSRHVSLEAISDERSDFSAATKHRVQIAVEMVINIAEHIVAGLNLGHPETAKELFPLLAKEKIIDEELSKTLQDAVGLRNILVHQYLDVDLGILTDSATTGLKDLREFAKEISEFLEKNKE